MFILETLDSTPFSAKLWKQLGQDPVDHKQGGQVDFFSCAEWV